MIDMQTVTITNEQTIHLGYQGENKAREIVFQQSGSSGETWTLYHKRPGDTTPYAVRLKNDGGNLVWIVTSEDTANKGGGQAQLVCTGKSGEILKTKIYRTEISASMAIANLGSTGSGGITPTGTLNINQNGTFDVTYYESAEVDVPAPDGYIKPEGTVTVTSNGTHDVESYKSVNVNVPTGSGATGTVTIESNGVHDVASYAKANVNVPVPEGYIQPSGTKTVTSNATYDIKAYEKVTVNVPSSGGTDTSDATLTAALCPSGYTFYADNEKKTGTMVQASAIETDNTSDILDYTKTDGTIHARYSIPQNMYLTAGTTFAAKVNASLLGDATAGDVAKGKFFTSVNGVRVAGTKEESSGIDTSDATLTEALCPSGYTFYANGEKKTGTMAQVSSFSESSVSRAYISSGTMSVIYSVPESMYRPSGSVFTAQLSASRFGNATADDVTKGKTFTSANGMLLTGTKVESSSSGSSGSVYSTTATLSSNYSTASWKQLCNIPFLGENISNSGLFVILNRVSATSESGAVSLCAASNGAYFNGNYFVSVIHGTYSASVDTLSSSNYALSMSNASSYTRIYADSSGNLYIRPDGSGTTFASGEYLIMYGIF